MKLQKRYEISANDVPQKIEDSVNKELKLLEVNGVAYIQDTDSKVLYHRFYRNGHMYDMYPKLAQAVKKYVKFKTAGEWGRELKTNFTIRSSLIRIETDEVVYLTPIERYIVDNKKYDLAVKVYKLHDALKFLGYSGDFGEIENRDFRLSRSVGSVQPSDQPSRSDGRFGATIQPSIQPSNQSPKTQVGRLVGSVQPSDQPSRSDGRFGATIQPSIQPSFSSINLEGLLKKENEENLLTLVKLASDILNTNKQILEELKLTNSLLKETSTKKEYLAQDNSTQPKKVGLNLHGEVLNTAKKYEENNRRQLLDGRFILGVLKKYNEYTSFGYSRTKTFRCIREDLEGRDINFTELYKEYSSVNVKFKGGREALGKIIDSYSGLEEELKALKDNPDLIPDKLKVILTDEGE